MRSPAADSQAPVRQIALGGGMQVGKTTAADHLVAVWGFEKDAIAAPIKRIASESFGWDGLKDEPGRRLLQELGSVGRGYDADLWLKRLADRLVTRPPSRLVIDDLRLVREVAFLRRLGFVCVRITRPAELIARLGEGRPGHETESEIDTVTLDHEIANDGGFDDFYVRLDALMERLGIGRPEA